MVDVLVAGAGPAGWAVACACARVGLHTALADPDPHGRWAATYGLWRDELPDLPAAAIAAAPPLSRAFGTREHSLARDYLVVDNDGLRRWLSDDRVQVLRGRVTEAVSGTLGVTVAFDGGRPPVAAAVAIDATGARRALGGGPPRSARAEQTAVGTVLTTADARRILPEADRAALFMDWRPPPGQRPHGAEPTFLYAVPLGGNRVLVEETSLARKPGLAPDVLASWLRDRLARAGLVADGGERVRIPLDLPVRTGRHAVPFGVAAGLVHPATGYSLATSLRLAPAVAAAVAEHLRRRGPGAAARAARQEIWPPAARTVHALRRHGLRALRSMPAEAVPEFFDLFFDLPTELQRAFTSGRTDVAGTTAAMATLFRTAPWRLRARLGM
jgi:lycopene beta-cyclase